MTCFVFLSLSNSKEDNSIDAFASGATSSIRIVSSVIVNLVAFTACVEFANQTISWFAIRVGAKLTIEVHSILRQPGCEEGSLNSEFCDQQEPLSAVLILPNYLQSHVQHAQSL